MGSRRPVRVNLPRGDARLVDQLLHPCLAVCPDHLSHFLWGHLAPLGLLAPSEDPLQEAHGQNHFPSVFPDDF